MKRPYLSFFALYLSIAACQQVDPKSNVESDDQCQKQAGKFTPSFKIVNGTETTRREGVVLLAGYRAGENGKKEFVTCTGVFLSSSTLLTAAHCIDRSPTGGVSYIPGVRLNRNQYQYENQMSDIVNKGVKPLLAIHAGLMRENSPANAADGLKSKLDLAVLVFPQGTAPGVFPLLDRAPSLGEYVTMVGFGYDSPEKSNQLEDIVKREGVSIISKWQPIASSIHVVSADTNNSGKVTSESKYSYTAYGDSGGPLIVGGGVVGILSGGSEIRDGVDSAFYVDLNANDSKDLIRFAKEKGADIPEPSARQLTSSSDLANAQTTSCDK